MIKYSVLAIAYLFPLLAIANQLNIANIFADNMVGQWQHYTFDIDYLLSLAGGVESNATPLNIEAVLSPLTIFPAWGANQSGTIFRIDNIKYTAM